MQACNFFKENATAVGRRSPVSDRRYNYTDNYN